MLARKIKHRPICHAGEILKAKIQFSQGNQKDGILRLKNLDSDYSNYGKQSVFVATKGTHKIVNGNVNQLITGTSYSTPDALSYAITLYSHNRNMSALDLKKCLRNIVNNQGFQIVTQGKINTSVTSCP